MSRYTSGSLDIGVYGTRGVPSTYSGYETFLTTLLPELVSRGDRVTMYCRTGEELGAGDWKGVRRRVLPAIPGKNLNTLSHGLVAGAVARVARHDVVLVVNVANAAYCALGRYTRQPVVLNTDGQEWLRDKWGTTARRIFKGSARIAGRCATGLIADCAAMAAVYRDEFHADSTVIPYCVPALDWVPNPDTPRAHALEPGRYLIVGGRHNPENNIHRVAEQIAASDLDIPLVVLGTANYDSPVTAQIADLAARDERIRMLGHIGDRPAFFDLIHHAAIYIHGHSVGGTNPSLVEAMGTRARICALGNAFNRETVGSAGRYFSLDPPDLVETVTTILAEPAEADLASRQGAADRAETRFSVDAVVDAYRQVLVEAARVRKAPVVVQTSWTQG